MIRGLIIDYVGVLDCDKEERDRWIRLITAVKEADVQVAILSNDPGGSGADAIREWEFTGTVDAVILSGEVGAEKPERAAFQAAADAVGLPLSDCVMIDDNIYNVRASVEYGMVGMLHTAFERTAVEIQAVFNIEGEF